jgi:hypothetical protein
MSGSPRTNARHFALLARVVAACLAMGTLGGWVVVSCSGDSNSAAGGGGSNAPSSQAMGRWTPATQDTCTQAFHDTFFVVGPDGKKYPTWHPAEATDPANNKVCSFGHDHGQDPSGSAMWQDLQQHFGFDANNNGTLDASELALSGIPFGYVSEQLVASTTPRTEDHTAYKITYSNLVSRSAVSGGNQFTSVDCDLFASYNQPTSTEDAFASNMFSVTYAVNCRSGPSLAQYPVKAIVSVMALYRAPGSFTLDAVGTQQTVSQSADPPTSPSGGNELGRRIPTDIGVFPGAFVVTGSTSDLGGLIERWNTQLNLRRSDFTVLATFSPEFRVDDPARYYRTDIGALARSVDLCYSGLNAAGALVSDPALAPTIVRQVRGVAKCSAIAPNGPGTGTGQRVAFDAPRSPFLGCARVATFGAEVVSNTGGPAIWYTNAFGDSASTVKSANSVKQRIDPGDTNSIVLAPATAGQQSVCSASTVHVPN